MKHQEQNYRAVFLLSEKTLPVSYCPEPITSVWDWALLSKDIALIYTNLLIPSFGKALSNCAHKWSLLTVKSENSWTNHDRAGYDPNIYTACQIHIHEIRNSVECRLCDAILRLHWAASSSSAKFRMWGRENPSARIFKKRVLRAPKWLRDFWKANWSLLFRISGLQTRTAF